MKIIMSILNYIMLFTLCITMYACDSDTAEKNMIKLTPLSPYQYEFTTQNFEKNAINYFFSERKKWQNQSYRKELEKNIKAIALKKSEKYRFFSVYVYAYTKQLNENFEGDYNLLKGTYDADLISYTRWKQGKLDIFYFIDSGNVVFDILKNTKTSPVWEFD